MAIPDPKTFQGFRPGKFLTKNSHKSTCHEAWVFAHLSWKRCKQSRRWKYDPCSAAPAPCVFCVMWIAQVPLLSTALCHHHKRTLTKIVFRLLSNLAGNPGSPAVPLLPSGQFDSWLFFVRNFPGQNPWKVFWGTGGHSWSNWYWYHGSLLNM